MSNNPLHLSVLNRGTIQFPRYLIGNEQMFWTGSGWTGIESNAVLFTDWNTVATEVQTLLLEHRDSESSASKLPFNGGSLAASNAPRRMSVLGSLLRRDC